MTKVYATLVPGYRTRILQTKSLALALGKKINAPGTEVEAEFQKKVNGWTCTIVLREDQTWLMRSILEQGALPRIAAEASGQ